MFITSNYPLIKRDNLSSKGGVPPDSPLVDGVSIYLDDVLVAGCTLDEH